MKVLSRFFPVVMVFMANVAQANLYTPPADAELTPFGAEKAGNKEGTIPPWTGKIVGVPSGLVYEKSGDPYPDPYANEKPLFTITSANYEKYKNQLSDGQIALFQKYPKTFQMPVYKTHRDFGYSDYVLRRNEWNLEHVKLEKVDKILEYTGGIPFPRPTNGAEAMWNGRLAHFYSTLHGYLDDVAVFPGGEREVRRNLQVSEFPYSNPDNIVGDTERHIGINAGFAHTTTELPERQKGEMIIVHEALDQVTYERQAWAYIPSTRRVRRAPTVGFDTPDGPGGLVTVDNNLGFNGAMYKYDWKLLGKREMYVPFHQYRFDDMSVNYETLLLEGHANPEFMRYELRRVWVVEATLKPDQRHVYGKRVFFIEEDSWQIVLNDCYDGRGQLWRVGILNTIYDYLLKVYLDRAQMFHDLNRRAYISLRMTNVKGQPDLMGEMKGEEYYSPNNLRQLGR